MSGPLCGSQSHTELQMLRLGEVSGLVGKFMAPASVFASAALAAIIGSMLLKAAGTAAREVIPVRGLAQPFAH